MKRISLFIIILISCLCDFALSQETLIDIALQKRKSIVSVISEQIKTTPASKPKDTIDPKTEKMTLSHKIYTVQAEKKGAGVIIDLSGMIVTNYHIVSSATHIKVKLYNNDYFYAKLILVSPREDLAILKIDAPYPIDPIEFVDSNTALLGQEIIHIGSSEILYETISGGRIIGLGTRSLKNSKKNVELIKVNINIYRGDSGGPILDKQGRLLGMFAAKLRGKQRASFAIPSNKIKELFLHVTQ